jgi:4-amino-4-deoxy-L-arabinose transferase-like glycosyltransferase
MTPQRVADGPLPRRHALLWALIVVGGVFLRFHGLAGAPAWYSDEGTNIAIAAELAEGGMGYMAVGDSSFINGHPHLFYLLLAGVFRIVGSTDISVARALAAGCTSLALALLYPTMRPIVGHRIALLGSAVYAGYPAAVLYGRMAFTYTLLAPLYLLAVYALHRWRESGKRLWLTAAGLIGGLAAITDLAGLSLLAFVVAAVVVRRPRHAPWVAPCLLPIAAWALWMWLRAGDAFLFDLVYTLSRLRVPLWRQAVNMPLSYYGAITLEPVFALGSLGILIGLPSRRARGLIAGAYLLSLAQALRMANLGGLGYYLFIPLQPLAAVGAGALAQSLLGLLPRLVIQRWENDLRAWLPTWLPAQRLWRRWGVLLANSVLIALFLLSPLMVMGAQALTASVALSDFAMLLPAGVFADPATARQAAAYVNARTVQTDVVLASPTIFWLLDAQAADFQMPAVAEGRDSLYLPGSLPPARLRFDPRLAHAAYVVVDDLWRGWASDYVPHVAALTAQVQETWVLETSIGAFDVYRNPRTP